MQLTEEAQASRPKLERWLDEFSERYSQAVVAASLAVAVFGPFLFKWPFLGSSGVRGSLYRALGLMVAASPCALAVAPLAYATAISACARKVWEEMSLCI
jgi:Cd2+/Zn2+-exporting ATPase